MDSSPSPAVAHARKALGLRLRELRIEAGLSARDLGRRLGRHPSKVSRIEHGTALPSPSDIRAWCKHCAAPDQEADLVASLRSVEGMYVEWRQQQRTGLLRGQESRIPLYERTRRFRIYEPGVIPGLFQTPEYATARMGKIIQFRDVPNDLEQAVAARMERQRVLRFGGRRFAVVLEEWALWSRVGGTSMMAAQLGHLLHVASWPSVSLGVIPRNVERTMWSNPGFWIFDEARVHVETPTAQLTITQPTEVAVYARTFAELASMALYGAAARSLITEAIGALGEDPPE